MAGMVDLFLWIVIFNKKAAGDLHPRLWNNQIKKPWTVLSTAAGYTLPILPARGQLSLHSIGCKDNNGHRLGKAVIVVHSKFSFLSTRLNHAQSLAELLGDVNRLREPRLLTYSDGTGFACLSCANCCFKP